MENEEKYIDIQNKLKNLEQVRASDNFVHNLNVKIVELESEKRKVHEKRYDEGRGGFLKNLFSNRQYPWLVPALGFTVLIFFVFYITFLNKNASVNNEQLLTDKKQETTEQKNTPSTQNNSTEKAPVENSDQNKSLTDKEKSTGKDIAGDMKIEKKENGPSPVENKGTYSDRDVVKSNRMELKTSQDETTKDDYIKTEEITKNEPKSEKQSEVQSEVQNDKTVTNGMVAQKPQTKVSSVQDDSDTMSDKKSNESSKSKKKLPVKVIQISKTDLEKIREEIVK